MPSGEQSYDINKSNYRITGKVSWSIDGSTITWIMSYTTYEYCVWSNSLGKNIFQGLSNSAVKLTVDGKSVQNKNCFSGYSYGTGASKSGWVKCKTGSLQTTTTLHTGEIDAIPEIVVPNKTVSLPFTLAWTVSYVGNNATSGSNANQTKIIDTDLTLSNNGFDRIGYTFVSWNTSSDGTGTSYAAGAVYTGNAPLTLYAVWQIITYSITYEGNGNTGGSTAVQTKEYGTPIQLNQNGFTRTDYVFLYWNTKADGTGISYEAGAFYSENAELTLYAIWHIVTYEIIYNGNGNTGGSTPIQIKDHGTPVYIQPNGFKKKGYAFLYWNTAADDSGTIYEPGDEYSINAALALYAIWKKSNIPVFVDLEGTIYQVEKAYTNHNGEIIPCIVYANPDGTIKELI